MIYYNGEQILLCIFLSFLESNRNALLHFFIAQKIAMHFFFMHFYARFVYCGHRLERLISAQEATCLPIQFVIIKSTLEQGRLSIKDR